MSTTEIRRQLHNYLEAADGKKIKALYTIIEKDVKENEYVFSEELKLELDKRYFEYKSGSVEMVTASESKERIENILKAGREK
jgi:hypothetical protein